jgi:predicted nucleotidyltransferase
MSTTADAAPVVQLPSRIQTYLDVLVGACAAAGPPLVSVILFGSTVRGGFSNISDVDLIIVLPDSATREDQARIRDEVARLETVHGFRPATTHPIGAFQARVERAVGHLFACHVCTRSDLLSGDVARIIGLQPVEAILIDRIVFAGIISSAVTVRGEDLLPHVPVPPIRRLDVFKALLGCCGGVLLSIGTFPMLPDATKYAMGSLKHSLHSCFFCYHHRTASLDEEVDFFDRRLGGNRTLADLLSLRRQYRKSFTFAIRCLPVVIRLHLLTAREHRFART